MRKLGINLLLVSLSFATYLSSLVKRALIYHWQIKPVTDLRWTYCSCTFPFIHFYTFCFNLHDDFDIVLQCLPEHLFKLIALLLE